MNLEDPRSTQNPPTVCVCVCVCACVCVADLAAAGRNTLSLSSSGMVFPQGLLVGIGPGRISETRTSSQSRGIYVEAAEETDEAPLWKGKCFRGRCVTWDS